MGTFIISEQEKKHILNLYGLVTEDIRPLQKLLECKITQDKKYIFYDGRAFSTETGDEVPITEGWLSDILHTGADLLSVGLDFVIPGSGAIIDVINAISYIIEAQFKSAQEEKDSLYLMAAITLAFVVMPGPLQLVAPVLKTAVKTGKGLASKAVVGGLKIIGGSLDFLLTKIPQWIEKALKSKFATAILGKYGAKISDFVTNFTTRIKTLFSKITGSAGKEGAQTATSAGAKEAGQTAGAKEIGQTASSKVSKEVSGDVFQKNHTLGDVGIPDEWWNLPADKMKSLIKKQDELLSSSVNSLINKTSNLAKKPFNPKNVKILNKSNVGGREIMEVQLENGQNVIFYKVTGMGGKTLPPPGAWSVVPGFLDNAYVQGKKVKKWFLKTEDTIGLTHKSLNGQGTNKYLTDMAQFLEKNGAEGLGQTFAKKSTTVLNPKLLPVTTAPVPKNLLPAVISKSDKLAKIESISLGSSTPVLLNKFGMKPGTTIKTSKGSFKFGNVVDAEYVIINGKKTKAWDFLKTYILKPSARLNTTGVPLITKALLRVVNDDGTINQNELQSLPVITPEQLQEDLNYLSQSVAEYQGGTGSYTVNTNAKNFQTALFKLGYKLPISCGRGECDGKFGPETKKAIDAFQKDNSLTTSSGKMDRLTARKLAELLKTKSITGTEEIQKTLNTI